MGARCRGPAFPARSAHDRRAAQYLEGHGAFVEGCAAPGSLQDRSGPSVGLEVGLLLPGVGADSGVGSSFAGIVSQRWSAMTLHVNGELLVTHDHNLGAFAGAIVEGPSKWAIR